MPLISTSALPVLAGLIAACVTTLGLFLVARQHGRDGGLPALFEIAAAGMLIMLCALHILPEALGLHPRAWIFILAGLGIGAGLALFQSESMREAGGPKQGSLAAPLIAIGLHSTLDGVLYAVAFETSLASGVSAAAGLILHEIPEGAVALTLLLRHGLKPIHAFGLAFLVAAATTPFGALISAPVIAALGEASTGALYALSAGFLSFMALGPMLTPLRTKPSRKGFFVLMLGAAFAFGLHAVPLGPHQHHVAHEHSEAHAH